MSYKPQDRAPEAPASQFEEVKEQLGCIEEDIILFDGYEEALIGYVERFGEDGHILVAAYDYDKRIDILKTRDGMSHEEAVEFFEFNTAGCYAGPKNPAFVKILKR